MRKYQTLIKSPDYKDNLSKININSILIPDKKERIIIIDTVTTGSNPKENNIMEIGCLEMIGGKITGLEFHAFLHPRYTINEVTKQKTNLNANFYDEYYKDAYASDHKVLEQFKNFVNQSVIVAHNAPKDMEFINNEFIFHKINVFPKKKFFCTLNIFRQMFPEISRVIFSLSKCCEYLDRKLPNKNFHSSIYDSFMVAKLMSKLFEIKEQIYSQNSNYNLINRQMSFNSENRNSNYHNNENYHTNTDFNQNIFNSYNSFNDRSSNFLKLTEDEPKNILQNKNLYKNDINFKKINSVNVISSSNNFDNIFNKKIEEKRDINRISDINNRDIKLLNNKRKLDFKDLIQNLKNKVNPNNNNEIKNSFNKNDIDLNLNANDFNVINKLIKE